MDWGPTLNSTEYVYGEPINITNVGNVPVNLTISYQNPINITAMTVGWNCTVAPLQPSCWVIVEVYQNVTAIGPYSYDTVITAVA